MKMLQIKFVKLKEVRETIFEDKPTVINAESQIEEDQWLELDELVGHLLIEVTLVRLLTTRDGRPGYFSTIFYTSR